MHFLKKINSRNLYRHIQNECITSGAQAIVNWNDFQSEHVISVYDENKLVGIGCMAGECHVHVRPTYEHREIETMVNKLLQAESKVSLVQANPEILVMQRLFGDPSGLFAVCRVEISVIQKYSL